MNNNVTVQVQVKPFFEGEWKTVSTSKSVRYNRRQIRKAEKIACEGRCLSVRVVWVWEDGLTVETWAC